MTEEQRKIYEKSLSSYSLRHVTARTRCTASTNIRQSASQKGDVSHMYEMILTENSQIIVAVNPFEVNPYDSKTAESLLGQMFSENQKLPTPFAYDRDGRGAK